MPPKFQSSFIPQGPRPTPGVIPQAAPVARTHDLLAFLAKGIFIISILLAVGVVGYRWYLGYSIQKMSDQLEAARKEVATGVTGELIRLNDRIVSTQALLDNHRVLTPVFSFLQDSTPRNVRFTDFTFLAGQEGPQLILKGEAKSYAALSLEASIIYKNKSFKSPVFSDIRLDDQGNVSFSLKTGVADDLISYAKTVSRTAVPVVVPIIATTTPVRVATSTATTTAVKTSTTTTTHVASTTSKTATTTH